VDVGGLAGLLGDEAMASRSGEIFAKFASVDEDAIGEPSSLVLLVAM
jgi:hypothetical protein